MIRTKLSLLEAVAYEMNCDYLSDLHFLNHHEQKQLAEKLRRLPAEDVPLTEWNDALNYLVQADGEKDAHTAKTVLIARLSQE